MWVDNIPLLPPLLNNNNTDVTPPRFDPSTSTTPRTSTPGFFDDPDDLDSSEETETAEHSRRHSSYSILDSINNGVYEFIVDCEIDRHCAARVTIRFE